MAKPKIALYWCSGCGGCEESVVDLAEDLVTIAESVQIVFWPVAMDYKYQDLEAMKEGEIAAALINGAIRMHEQEHIARLLREKSKLVIAHGSCAHLGGVVGLANFYTRDDLLARAYREVPSLLNPQGTTPQEEMEESGRTVSLSGMFPYVKTLDQVIEVDYYIPGCPPPPELVKDALMAVLKGKLPPRGAVLAETKSLCDTCSRKESKPERLAIHAFKRIYETEADPGRCFLGQGVICLGPVTRGGCGERCLKANMPCRGCFGPLDTVVDQGAKSVSFLSSILDTRDDETMDKVAASIPDAAGLFYRYSLPSSLLGRRISKETM